MATETPRAAPEAAHTPPSQDALAMRALLYTNLNDKCNEVELRHINKNLKDLTIGQTCAVKAGQVAPNTGKNFTGMCVVKLLNAWHDAASIGLPNDSIASITLGPQTPT